MDLKKENNFVVNSKNATPKGKYSYREPEILKNKINLIEEFGLVAECSPIYSNHLKASLINYSPTSIKIGEFMSSRTSKNIISTANLQNAIDIVKYDR